MHAAQRRPTVVAVIAPRLLTRRELALGFSLVVGLAAAAGWAESRRTETVVAAHDRLEAEERSRFQKTRSRVERVLRSMYQNGRTISLLPPVRAIEGGNLPAGVESAVDAGRLSAEARAIVQQIYNNTASDVSVSEVYCVVEGFDPEAGETPFFMYDELILGAGRGLGDEDDSAVDDDYPEEYEGDEYRWFVENLPRIAAKYGRFRYSSLDQIPAWASPALRTCDNSQYVSRSTGDVHEASGLVLAIPFYGLDDAFRGVIAVIFRLNVLEALLIDRPFVPALPDDVRRMHREGWSLPERPARFLLVNDERGIAVADRRAEGLEQAYRDALAGQAVPHLLEPVDAPTDTGWKLFYRLDLEQQAAIEAAALRTCAAQIGALLSMALLGLGWLVAGARKRARVLHVATLISQLSEGEGNLQERLDTSIRDETGVLAQAFNGFVEPIEKTVRDLRTVAVSLSSATAELNAAVQSQSGAVASQVTAITQATTSLGALREAADSNDEKARLVEETAGTTFKGMEEIRASVQELAATIQGLSDRSLDIVQILDTVNDIADQSNVLALNASIEAAKAGDFGRGFSVVAHEVRNLAQQSQQATVQIRGMLRDLRRAMDQAVEQAGRGVAQVEHHSAGLAVATSAVGAIVEATSTQARSIDLIAGAANEISSGLAAAEVGARSLSDTATDLVEQTQVLGRALARLSGEGGVR